LVKDKDGERVRDLPRMVADVKAELAPVEEQWGIKVHEFGFSTFSPTPETLEITQLRKLAEEKLALYRQFREGGLGETAAVALISGSVVALPPREAADRVERPPQPAPVQVPLPDFDSVGHAIERGPE